MKEKERIVWHVVYVCVWNSTFNADQSGLKLFLIDWIRNSNWPNQLQMIADFALSTVFMKRMPLLLVYYDLLRSFKIA